MRKCTFFVPIPYPVFFKKSLFTTYCHAEQSYFFDFGRIYSLLFFHAIFQSFRAIKNGVESSHHVYLSHFYNWNVILSITCDAWESQPYKKSCRALLLRTLCEIPTSLTIVRSSEWQQCVASQPQRHSFIFTVILIQPNSLNYETSQPHNN